jgi:hypothetical protein
MLECWMIRDFRPISAMRGAVATLLEGDGVIGKQ